MRRRQVWIAGVFVDVKTHRRLNRGRGRGLAAMTIQALLVASVQNIQKLARAHRPDGLAMPMVLRMAQENLLTVPCLACLPALA